MSAPLVKGWCPGAHRPMRSGDGLVVRLRPFRGEVSAVQVLALCDLSRRYGSGLIELTSRGNLQIRGVSSEDHPKLLQALDGHGLIDSDPAQESRRNILVAPDRAAGDLTDRLYDGLLATLPGLPPLPEKMGVVLDTGARAVLGAGSGDFRFELATDGGLILRADGAARGRRIAEDGAMAAMAALAQWFVETGGRTAGRMARHLRRQPLPQCWQEAAPRAQSAPPVPGPEAADMILGAPFGSLEAAALEAVMRRSGAVALRPMLGRLIRLRHARAIAAPGFVTTPGARLLEVDACPGAPLCPRATVDTRALARQLAPRTRGRLHVSGCAKGCANPRAADITLVGRDGGFDLVRNGTAADPPARRGLAPPHLIDLIGMT
ncbi:cobalamin biosynthesis protein CobG [Marinovum sp. SP66]|uniref:cobalamin biosynthesis protein CobG n=1 Tax=Marinovum TaxID=367771 RepID=UPI00237BCD65|nr:cobalamin biosynthesis protein CobG [Marinovum sp. SP66]MDD9738876.1 cobalamin biosynthesis protein CobG [Marinovum sp. SP66]